MAVKAEMRCGRCRAAAQGCGVALCSCDPHRSDCWLAGAMLCPKRRSPRLEASAGALPEIWAGSNLAQLAMARRSGSPPSRCAPQRASILPTAAETMRFRWSCRSLGHVLQFWASTGAVCLRARSSGFYYLSLFNKPGMQRQLCAQARSLGAYVEPLLTARAAAPSGQAPYLFMQFLDACARQLWPNISTLR